LNTRSTRNILFALAACMALQITGYTIILPLFARRFSDFGGGVAALSASSLAYALAGALAAPFMGALADRFGRRPLVLISLAVYIGAFSGYLLATSSWALILLRGVAGAFTAGLVPAMTGIVADLAPADRRAQWLGILSGGASAGWIVGPLLGGALYDRWGYAVPLAIAIALAGLTFSLAAWLVPETRPGRVTCPGQAAHPMSRRPSLAGLRQSLPQSLPTFLALLAISFAVMFAWAFVEPQFMFYAYDGLRWTSAQLGLAMSVYGVFMTLGELACGRLSDRAGRKPVLILGLGLFCAQFAGLLLCRDFARIALSFALAGFGNALYDPALSAYLLDIAPAEHKARIMGLKSMAGALGNLLGPALVVLFTGLLRPQGIFLIATLLVALLTAASAFGIPSGQPSNPVPSFSDRSSAVRSEQ